MEPDVTAQLVCNTSESTTDWCVAEGGAKAPTNHSPDATPDGKAEGMEEQGKGTSNKGFHECMNERTLKEKAAGKRLKFQLKVQLMTQPMPDITATTSTNSIGC